ncbi:hypothetical protein [Methylobacter sp. BBA5.1]|uniref:hypothetical protein n=1 Tax=Methylobacter sp. BBA5.1 TaxID=1495064 RepID=UPI00190F87A2|nr:hypothetical protein [Methylobacter sp. BBA5.1]
MPVEIMLTVVATSIIQSVFGAGVCCSVRLYCCCLATNSWLFHGESIQMERVIDKLTQQLHVPHAVSWTALSHVPDECP